MCGAVQLVHTMRYGTNDRNYAGVVDRACTRSVPVERIRHCECKHTPFCTAVVESHNARVLLESPPLPRPSEVSRQSKVLFSEGEGEAALLPVPAARLMPLLFISSYVTRTASMRFTSPYLQSTRAQAGAWLVHAPGRPQPHRRERSPVTGKARNIASSHSSHAPP